MPQNKAWTV